MHEGESIRTVVSLLMTPSPAFPSTRCFGGTLGFYRHASQATGGTMRFGVYRPARPRAKCPVLYYLAGLTCTEETFLIKAGAQRVPPSWG